jgi:hypothetical protein
VAAYFEQLPVKENGSINKIIGQVLGVRSIEDVRVISATVEGSNVLDEKRGLLLLENMPVALGDLMLADPQLPTMLNVTIRFPEAETPPDTNGIREALHQAVTTLNDANSTDLPASPSAAELEARRVSYAKLLHVIPLPVTGHENAQTLATFDPMAAVPDVAPYVVSFIVVQERGLSQTLIDGTVPYDLTPFERLSLNTVELQPEAAG